MQPCLLELQRVLEQHHAEEMRIGGFTAMFGKNGIITEVSENQNKAQGRKVKQDVKGIKKGEMQRVGV